jgi:hypothetical protein
MRKKPIVKKQKLSEVKTFYIIEGSYIMKVEDDETLNFILTPKYKFLVKYYKEYCKNLKEAFDKFEKYHGFDCSCSFEDFDSTCCKRCGFNTLVCEEKLKKYGSCSFNNYSQPDKIFSILYKQEFDN